MTDIYPTIYHFSTNYTLKYGELICQSTVVLGIKLYRKIRSHLSFYSSHAHDNKEFIFYCRKAVELGTP